MRVSIWPSPSPSWSDTLEVVRHADVSGWDGVYVADHFMGEGDTADGGATPVLDAKCAELGRDSGEIARSSTR